MTTPTFDSFLSELRECSWGSGWNLVVVRCTESSNKLARRISRELSLDNLPVPAVAVVAFEQTAGRGRLGRTWSSPPGGGVYASLLLPAPPAERLTALPLVTPLAICRVLDHYLDRRCRLKWPNDLLVDGHKIGGVLVETTMRPEGGEAIVGFGVNHSRPRGEAEAGGATSMSSETDAVPGLGVLTWELLWSVGLALRELDAPEVAAHDYLERSVHRPGDRIHCRLPQRSVEGKYLGLTEEGFLRLEVNGGEEVVSAGEVVEP